MSVSGGNNVDLSGIAHTTVSDADNDTKIYVEKNSDEDIIRIDADGTEVLRMSKTANGQPVLVQPNGLENTIIGNFAGSSLSTGYSNILIGRDAGKFGSSMNRCVFIGEDAGESNVSGIGSTFIGNEAGDKSNANFNTFIGAWAGLATTTGGDNTFVGQDAGLTNKTGGGNTYLGKKAGEFNLSGSGNVFIGREAGGNEMGSNKLYIDNSNTSSPLVYGDFSSNLLKVNGTLNVNDAFSFPTADGSADQILQTDGSGMLSWANASTDTDDQNLSLSGNTLNITDGTGADLSAFMDNTDAQDLSLSGNTLSLSNDGTPVDLSAFLDDTDTDDQDLSLSGTTLDITDGTGADLSVFLDNTDAQDLSLSGNTLSLSNDGTTVDLSGYLDNTDVQMLSLSGSTLTVSGGNNVDLSAITHTFITDANGDTKIQVEESSDEDIIRMDAGDTEVLTVSKNTNGQPILAQPNPLANVIFGNFADQRSVRVTAIFLLEQMLEGLGHQ